MPGTIRREELLDVVQEEAARGNAFFNTSRFRKWICEWGTSTNKNRQRVRKLFDKGRGDCIPVGFLVKLKRVIKIIQFVRHTSGFATGFGGGGSQWPSCRATEPSCVVARLIHKPPAVNLDADQTAWWEGGRTQVVPALCWSVDHSATSASGLAVCWSARSFLNKNGVRASCCTSVYVT